MEPSKQPGQHKDPNGVYVGNLPYWIGDDEIENLFCDFENVDFRRIIRKERKTYCFLSCRNRSDVINVVQAMDKYVVQGRSLCVRALDERLQETLGKSNENVLKSFTDYSEDTVCSSSSACNRDSGQEENEKGSVLHVSNFPFGVDEDELYVLFEDFEPLEVLITCNSYAPQSVTEAYIVVPTEQHALDAIMNFDNTVYRCRTLLVANVEEPHMIPELVSLQAISSSQKSC